MKWYAYIGYFFAGAFIANAIPHLVHGVSSQEFQTPFGRPSPAIVNVFWGFFNLAAGYVTLTLLKGLTFSFTRQVGMTASGFLAMAANLAFVF